MPILFRGSVFPTSALATTVDTWQARYLVVDSVATKVKSDMSGLIRTVILQIYFSLRIVKRIQIYNQGFIYIVL